MARTTRSIKTNGKSDLKLRFSMNNVKVSETRREMNSDIQIVVWALATRRQFTKKMSGNYTKIESSWKHVINSLQSRHVIIFNLSLLVHYFLLSAVDAERQTGVENIDDDHFWQQQLLNWTMQCLFLLCKSSEKKICAAFDKVCVST